MKSKLREQDISRIVNKVLNKPLITEGVTGLDFSSLWNNFPKNSSAYEIFPNIIPKVFNSSPDSFQNACATRLSLALNNIGKRPYAHFITEKDWTYDGVLYPKGKPITTAAKNTPPYLTGLFGRPTYTFENTQENIQKYITGKDVVFVITNVPGWSASGHVDIHRKDGKCGQACHFDEGGTMQAWVINEIPMTKQQALDTLVGFGKNKKSIEGFGDDFLIAWARAKKSGLSFFYYNGKKFDGNTARSIN
jgi:hypothetical protein